MTSFKFIFCLLISVPIGTVLQYTIASIHHAQKCTRNLCLHCLLKAYSFKNRYRLKVNLTDSRIKIYKYIVEFINSKSYKESVLHARRPFHQFLVLCELSIAMAATVQEYSFEITSSSIFKPTWFENF